MDEALLRSLNAWSSNDTVAAIAIVLSSPWMWPLVGLPLLVLQLRKRRWSVVLSTVLAVTAADQISAQLIKPIVERERPCRALTGLHENVSCGVGKSFPSAHASNSFAVTVAATDGLRFGWAAVLPVAILISFSRVVLGVHYPSDVLGGAAIGASLGLAAMAIRKKLAKKA